jgi:hypothetical protein
MDYKKQKITWNQSKTMNSEKRHPIFRNYSDFFQAFHLSYLKNDIPWQNSALIYLTCLYVISAYFPL